MNFDLKKTNKKTTPLPTEGDRNSCGGGGGGGGEGGEGVEFFSASLFLHVNMEQSMFACM